MNSKFLNWFLICAALIKVISAACSGDDAYEPNESASYPWALTVANYTSLKVCGASPDFFLFNFNLSDSESKLVEVSLSYSPDITIDLAALNVAGYVIAEPSDAKPNTMTFVVGPNSTSVIVSIRFFAGLDRSPMPYDLHIYELAMDPCTTDSHLPEKSEEGYTLTSFGSFDGFTICHYRTWNDSNSPVPDADVFNIPLAANTAAKVTVTREDSLAGSLILKLRDSEGKYQPVYGVQSTSNVDQWIAVGSAGGSGTTLVAEVSLASDGYLPSTAYNISVENQGTCTSDKLEPNDTPQTASPITVGQYISDLAVCGWDNDFFLVTLKQGGANIQVFFPQQATQIRVTVSSSDNLATFAEADFLYENSYLYFYVPFDGQFLIRIYPIPTVEGGYGTGTFPYGLATCQSSSSCFTRTYNPGCDDPTIQSCVCAALPSCCSNVWDSSCEGFAGTNCNAGCGYLLPSAGGGTLAPGRNITTQTVQTAQTGQTGQTAQTGQTTQTGTSASLGITTTTAATESGEESHPVTHPTDRPESTQLLPTQPTSEPTETSSTTTEIILTDQDVSGMDDDEKLAIAAIVISSVAIVAIIGGLIGGIVLCRIRRPIHEIPMAGLASLPGYPSMRSASEGDVTM